MSETGLHEADRLRRSDGAARERAQHEFARPFLLEAGAGSGKTATLVARILAWCLGPGWEKAEVHLGQASAVLLAWGGLAKASGSAAGEARGAHRASRARPPQATTGGELAETAARVLTRLAAITFTEAAAAEMAERVGSALAVVERGELPVGFARGVLAANDETLSARARALVGELDRLNVSTIHAFCRRLLAAFPLEAGLPPAFEIDAEGDELDQVLQETLDEALPELYGSGAPASADALTLATLGLGPREIAEAVRELVATGVPPEALAQSPFTP
jgi:ATP-dependent helicase/nuclease subunit A